MRIIATAFSNMICMAVQHPSATAAGLIATAFSLRGVKFLAAYLTLVVIGGIAFGAIWKRVPSGPVATSAARHNASPRPARSLTSGRRDGR